MKNSTAAATRKACAGEDIHPYARIVAVADVFDALMHKRCYKEAWPTAKVTEHLREVAGHHLDPHVCRSADPEYGQGAGDQRKVARLSCTPNAPVDYLNAARSADASK